VKCGGAPDDMYEKRHMEAMLSMFFVGLDILQKILLAWLQEKIILNHPDK
jgi:hypothetical protein